MESSLTFYRLLSYLAAGGLYSTVLDVRRWDQALYTDRLVSTDLLATMFQPMTTIPDVPDLRYGYGFYVGTMAGRLFVGLARPPEAGATNARAAALAAAAGDRDLAVQITARGRAYRSPGQ